MRFRIDDEKALSTVVTTLIILVVSVLLAGVVTLYAINITSTRTQQEDLRITKQKVWVFSNGTAYAAFSIDNVGGRDVVLDKIQVRGVEVSWSSVHYLRRSSSFSASLNPPNSSGTHDWSSFTYATGESAGSFSTASSDLPLASGDTMVIYIKDPDSINLNDIGTTIGITVFTENAQYYVECNVETSVNA
ncbi:type IV pilin [Candidatus Bathyarchaeota archaeon]|nr:MAG: type IV pilin [Candidatus Bathyarchaeota archaeon]